METKAKIIGVGSFDELGNPVGWMFDGTGSSVAAISLGDSPLFAGYTIEELKHIADLDTLGADTIE